MKNQGLDYEHAATEKIRVLLLVVLAVSSCSLCGLKCILLYFTCSLEVSLLFFSGMHETNNNLFRLGMQGIFIFKLPLYFFFF